MKLKIYGRMAELVDALDSKSNSRNTVRVRFSLRPPCIKILFTKFIQIKFNFKLNNFYDRFR